MQRLTPEDIAAIKAALLEDLTPAISEAVEAKVGTLEESLETQLSRMFSSVENASQQGFNQFLDQLIEEADQLQLDYGDDDADDDDDDDYDDEPVTRAKDAETMRMEEKIKRMEAEIVAEKRAREQAEALRVAEANKAKAIQQLSGKVLPGTEEQLLTILETKGLVDDDYNIIGRDKFGEVKKPLSESVDELLSSQFAHFAPPRSGSGTGGSNSSTMNSARVEVKPEVVQSALNDPVKIAELAKALQQEIQS